MKLKTAFLFGVLALPAFAHAFEFKVSLVDQVLMQDEHVQSENLSLGQLSDQRLRAAVTSHRLNAYLGSAAGVSSINGYGSEIEVLSSQALNAYGWCFSVDGKKPVFLANQYYFHGTEKTVEWFYGFAHSERNQWTSMCERATHLPVAQP